MYSIPPYQRKGGKQTNSSNLLGILMPNYIVIIYNFNFFSLWLMGSNPFILICALITRKALWKVIRFFDSFQNSKHTH